MQLLDLFALSLTGRRDAVALECETAGGGVARYTFGDIDARRCRMALVLEAHGLRAGDRLGVFLPNRIEYIDLFLACITLGVILVPINILYREREIGHIVADAEPRSIIARAADAELFPLTVDVWAVEGLRDAMDAVAATPFPVRRPLDGDTLAALIFTSGTTGRPKGAMLTHDNFAANAVNLVTCWRVTSDDRYLGVLPLFHVHGLGNGVCSWLVSGNLMHLAERFEHQRAAEMFDAFRPTLFFGVPTIYVRLLQLAPDVAARIGAGMRLFVSGSAPLPAHVLEAFRERFGHTILERYGMSETLMTLSNPYAGERRPGTVGFPLPGLHARLTPEIEGGDPPADHVVGRLEVRGSTVFAGYWRNPEATTAAFDGPWFRTGDLAERSADGYYTLRGRSSDLIISGGFNIYPREIEDVLLQHAGVREVAVVGVPDEVRGEVPVAYIVIDPSVDLEALDALCRQSLASFKVPRAFIPIESLPRTALGKIKRQELAK